MESAAYVAYVLWFSRGPSAVVVNVKVAGVFIYIYIYFKISTKRW